MIVLALDPGNERSAFATYDGAALLDHGIADNRDVLRLVRRTRRTKTLLAIEMIASYGMPVGAEVFETCMWIGRYVEAWGGPSSLVFRREVKLHLCGNVRARDSNIRQSLIDRFGPGKAKAIGCAAAPGPLHGVAKDVWAALGVAVTFHDRHKEADMAQAPPA